ncbi:MAG: FecR domain-containing protein [Tannerellaceae bacterium]|nr:FecR domain-containing protein [Tannerellaceae bacterium]
MYENQDIEAIIINYLAGESTAEELLYLSGWLREDPQNKQVFTQLQSYWKADVSPTATIDYDRTFEQLLRKTAQTQIPRQTKTIRLHMWRVAAIAAILAGILFAVPYLFRQTPGQQFTYISGNGVAEFTLPDSTRITLNKNTVLTYTHAYGKEKREVSLTGEAWFEVEKDENCPFVVDMEENRITVLGTAFSVRNRPEEKSISAVLVEGSIRFESPGQTILITPEQKLIYHKANQGLELIPVDIDLAVAWKKNLITYKSQTFKEICELLEDHYGVKLNTMDETIKEDRYTGTFDGDLDIERIFVILGKNIPFKWEKVKHKTYSIEQ